MVVEPLVLRFNTSRFATPMPIDGVVIGYTVCSMAVQDDLWCPKAKTEFGGTNQKKFYMLQGHSTLVLQSILLVRGGRTTIARMKPVFENGAVKKFFPTSHLSIRRKRSVTGVAPAHFERVFNAGFCFTRLGIITAITRHQIQRLSPKWPERSKTDPADQCQYLFYPLMDDLPSTTP